MRPLSAFLLTLVFFSAYSQEWLSQYQKSVDYFNAAQLTEAKESALLALETFKAENLDLHKNLAAINKQLALITYEQGDLDDAVSYAQTTVEILQQLNEDSDLDFARALSNLALIRNERSEYETALPLFERAIFITKQYLSENTEEMAELQGNYAVCLYQLRRDGEATQFFERSLATLRDQPSLPPGYINILYNYGTLQVELAHYDAAYRAFSELEGIYSDMTPAVDYGKVLILVGDALDHQGKFAEAIEKYDLAIATFDQLNEHQSPEYVVAQNLLSIDLYKVGRFADAEGLVVSVLKSREINIASDPLGYAVTSTNYGNLLIGNGKFTDARGYLTGAIQAYKTYGLPKDLTYISALEGKSKIELAQDDPVAALNDINLAIEVGEQEKLTSGLHSLYNQKAKVLLREGKYADAQNVAERAMNLSVISYGTQSIQTAYVQMTLARVYGEQGSYSKAAEQYDASLPVFESAFGRQHPEYATVAANYSSLLQLIGSYGTAEVLLTEAVEIKQKAYGDENLDFLATYENLGLLYSATARYVESTVILEQIKEIKERILPSNDPSIAYTYSNLGSIKKQVADYNQSESYFRNAITIYEKSLGKTHILYASTINNLALLYQKMGNTPYAKPLFLEAMAIYEDKLGKLSPDYATTLVNLATLYQLEGDNSKAKEALEEVLEIDRKLLGTNHPLYSKTLHNLASVYEETKEFEKAKELYTESLAIDARIFGTNHPSYASTLYNLAVLEQELGNYTEAKQHYLEVVRIRLELLGENHPDYAYALYGLASISQKTGDYEEARKNYQVVINNYLRNIQNYFPALSEGEKSAFYAKIRPVFEAGMDFILEYVEGGHGTQVDRNQMLSQLYNLQLSTKALLLNATNKVKNRILNSGDQELILLFQKWIAQKENLVKSYALSKQEIAENNIDLAALEEESNDMEKQLSLKSTAFAQEFEQDQPTWEQVRDRLVPGEVAIEMIRIRKNLKNDSIVYAMLIVAQNEIDYPKLVLLANGNALEDRGFKTYKNSIVYKVTDNASYDIFWKPIDKVLPANTKNIYLSADGVYNKINLATLLDGQQYVVEKYNIRILSNTKELIEATEQPNPTNFAEVFGFPRYNLAAVQGGAKHAADSEGLRYSFGENISELPGTLVELENITAIMDKKAWQYTKYIEANASEANIKKINNPKIFHIATHGFFLSDMKASTDANEGISSRSMKYNPLMRSGLLLAGAENTMRNEKISEEDDGILTAYEAMNLNLDNTDLVVMSACETGLGEVKNGEGVYGLQRAFMVAGAQNLIMSLWKVNDETTQLLMSSFYSEWFAGRTKNQAFNNAIQIVKKDFKEPYYWGAFVLLGK